VTVLCDVLSVSCSGFYAWREREPSQRQLDDARLDAEVLAIFEESHRRYGSPRIHQELKAKGERVSRRRVSRLMCQRRLAARRKRAFAVTTSAHDSVKVPNVLRRDFTASRPNQKWVGDITYLPTSDGFLYLAMLMDLHSRRIIGWSISNTMEQELTLRALDMALATRHLDGPLIHHTDRGVQYATNAYVARLGANATRSMSREANCWDNAPAESFFSSMKHELAELLRTRKPRGLVTRGVLDYIAWYNLERRHSSIGYVSPVDFEHAVRMGRAA
jgi:transposase InsO family protein